MKIELRSLMILMLFPSYSICDDVQLLIVLKSKKNEGLKLINEKESFYYL